MKNVLLTALLLLVLFSCEKQKNKKLLNNLHGRWKLETVIYKRAMMPDSTVTFDSSYLEFEKCDVDKNSTARDCELIFSRGKYSVSLNYQATFAPKGTNALAVYATGEEVSGEQERLFQLLQGLRSATFFDDDASLKWEGYSYHSSEIEVTALLKRN